MTKVVLFCLFIRIAGAAGFCATGDDLINLYGQLSGKTVLAPSSLKTLPDSEKFELPEEKAKALEKIENEFSRMDVSVVEDGPHFVRLIPEKLASFFLTNMPLRGAQLAAQADLRRTQGTNTGRGANEIIPAGVVNFLGVYADDVANIFEELARVTVLRPFELPPIIIRFRTQTELSKDEVIYGLETVLGLNGVGVKHDGTKFVLLGPLSQIQAFKSQAPPPDFTAKLLDPDEVPSVGVAKPNLPRTPIEERMERLRKAFHEFLHPPRPRDQSVQRLFEFYAQLRDKKAEPSNYFESLPVKFKIKTPVTREDLIYAIETTLALNSVVVTEVDAETLGLKDKAEKTRRIYKPKTQQLYPPKR